MSSFGHNRSRIDEELTADGSPAPGRAHRFRRTLSVLVIAVALPAAFAASPASAADAPARADTELTYSELGECAWLMEAPEDATCKTASDTDISGEWVVTREQTEDQRVGQAGKHILTITIKTVVRECHDDGTLRICTTTTTTTTITITSTYNRDGTLQSVDESSEGALVKSP